MINNWFRTYTDIIEENHINVNDLGFEEKVRQLIKTPSLWNKVENPDMALMKALVTKEPDFIQFIKDPPLKVQLWAVTEWGAAIKHIADPAPIIQLEAVKSKPSSVIFIKNPTEQVADYLDSLKQ